MRDWKLSKNAELELSCWQIYYNDSIGRRYYGQTMSYPKAASLRDALMNAEIRIYALEFVQISNAEQYPSNKAFEYRKAHFDTYQKMLRLSCKYNADIGLIYERLIVDAMGAE